MPAACIHPNQKNLTFLHKLVYTINMTRQNIIQPEFDWAAIPGQKYDITSKSVFRAFPQDVARYLMNEPTVKFVEFIDSELPLVETRDMDILMKMEIRGTLTLVHFEIQAGESTHQRMVRRTVGYIGRGYEKHGLPIRSHVIYLRPGAGRNDPGVYTQSDPGYRIHIEYQVIRLYELDGQSVLDAANVGLIPFAPLMQPPADTEGIAWVQQCIEATRGLPLAPLSRPDYLTSLGILGGLAHEPNAIGALIPKEVRMESGFYRLMQEEARQSVEAETRAKVEEETRAKIEAETRAKIEAEMEETRAKLAAETEETRAKLTDEARQQATRENAIESILEVLDVRFQSTLVPLFKAQLEKVDDLQQLKQLHREAAQAPSLEAFTETLVQNGNH